MVVILSAKEPSHPSRFSSHKVSIDLTTLPTFSPFIQRAKKKGTPWTLRHSRSGRGFQKVENAGGSLRSSSWKANAELPQAFAEAEGPVSAPGAALAIPAHPPGVPLLQARAVIMPPALCLLNSIYKMSLHSLPYFILKPAL